MPGEAQTEPPRLADGDPAKAAAEGSSFDIVSHYFDTAAGRLRVPDGLRRVLSMPEREVKVQIPIRLHDRQIHVFSGYRVQHNAARVPYKGGIRYHERADLDEVRGHPHARSVVDSPAPAAVYT